MTFRKSVNSNYKVLNWLYSGDVSGCVKDVESYRFRVPFILFVTDDKGNYKALDNWLG